MSVGTAYSHWSDIKTNLKNRLFLNKCNITLTLKEISKINVKLTILRFCSLDEIDKVFNRSL